MPWVRLQVKIAARFFSLTNNSNLSVLRDPHLITPSLRFSPLSYSRSDLHEIRRIGWSCAGEPAILFCVIQATIALAVITLIPALELRASIPIGFFGPDKLGFDLSACGVPSGTLGVEGTFPLGAVLMVCILVNILLGWVVFLVMGPMFTLLRKWLWFDRRIWPMVQRTQKKLQPYVEKYGETGVAVFIGIPLPGSGVYTGALGSYLIGLDKKKFMVANVIGVLIAALAVTSLCLVIHEGFVADDSLWARLFMKSH